jgi:LmbE family N-acetylglucosaminyl deacetylase
MTHPAKNTLSFNPEILLGDVLFAYAHPDDETLTRHLMARVGRAAFFVATRGERSTIDNVGSGFCPERAQN